MKHLSTKISAIGASIALLPYVAHAQFGDLTKVNQIAGQGGAGYNTDSNALTIIGRIIGVALGLTGIIFVLYMIYAGFLWMTAGGSGESITKAKDIIRNCIIGLIIITLAYAITSFVFAQLGSAVAPTP